MFGVVKDATIKNLTLKNVNIGLLGGVGGSVGAVVGYAEGSTIISNCTVGASTDDNSVINGSTVGGIVGRVYGKDADNAKTANISGCVNYAKVVASVSDEHATKAAGIVGFTAAGKGNTITVSDCVNHGEIVAYGAVQYETRNPVNVVSGIVNYGYDNNRNDVGASYSFSNNTNNGNLRTADSGLSFIKAIATHVNNGYIDGKSYYYSFSGNTNNGSCYKGATGGEGGTLDTTVVKISIVQGNTEADNTSSSSELLD